MADSSVKNHRVQFDFTPEAYNELKVLQQQLQVPTTAEAVRYAIRTLQWVVAAVAEGQSIFLDDGDTTKEVIFPFVTSKVAKCNKQNVSVGAET